MSQDIKPTTEEEDPECKLARKISLNFSDKDEKENPKFNDARLIDVIRNYPLLYNKCLESYGDPDYTNWMWGEVASEMNEYHRKTSLSPPFTAVECQTQWEKVKRALQYLCNPAAKSFRYPKHFRECLDFFQNYIKDRQEPARRDSSRDCFLHQVPLLEQMPFEKQLALEKDITNIILSNELEFCAPVIDPQAVENQACEDFGNVMALLMPEADLQVAKNELNVDLNTVVEDAVQQSDTPADSATGQITDVSHLLELYTKSGITLKPAGSQLDLDSLLELPSKQVKIIIPEKNIQYTIQGEVLSNILNRDGEEIEQKVVVEQNADQSEVQKSGTEEVILQECVFQDDIMQEDLIEEVVTQGPGKDMPSLDMDGSFEVSNNRLDFSVLNEML